MVQRKFDAIHEFFGSFQSSLRSTAALTHSTIFPIVMNDDAMGDPMDFKAHPEHASWSEVAYPNCFPDSEIRNMKIRMLIIMPEALANKTSRIKLQYALISCAFPEDLDALDEKSGLTVKEILEIQKETTDRQTYPLWTSVDMPNGSTLHANIPGLTTDQKIEGVDFNSEIFRDQMRYGKVRGLLKKCTPIGLRDLYITNHTANAVSKTIRINFTPSNAKFINPHTFLGLLVVFVQQNNDSNLNAKYSQPNTNTDITSGALPVIVAVHVQYNERNPEFHMSKV